MGAKVWDFWANKYERLWVQKYSLSPTRRDIIKVIKKLIKPDMTYNILDMGCGIGQLLRDMQDEFKDFNIDYTGVDISPKMIQIAKEKDSSACYINSSVEAFKDNEKKFDIVICSHSFPYYKDKEGAINKFSSLLKNEGHLLLAQASANSAYDKVAMFFVKFTTGSAEYLSAVKIKEITKGEFNLLKIHNIKEKFYMPSICLFHLKKKGEDL